MIRRQAVQFSLLAIAAVFGSTVNGAPRSRMVRGIVTGQDGTAVANAVVKLKCEQYTQIRSFITQADGSYRFSGLNPNFDYTLQARHQGRLSKITRLSRFDAKEEHVADLSLQSNR